jgi:hypothetical protein
LVTLVPLVTLIRLALRCFFSAARAFTPTPKKTKQAQARVKGRVKNVMAFFLLNA